MLIQLTKTPVPGQVKTRLISVLGEEGSCDLHKKLTRCMAKVLSNVPNMEYQLWSSNAGEYIENMVNEFQLIHHLQVGVGLGERLQHCVEQSIQKYSNILIVGSDCPFINEDTILQACKALNNKPVVFVPANDGGYVLIGLRIDVNTMFNTLAEHLFKDMPWGSNKVLETSIKRLEKLGVSYSLLPPLSDIDRPEDLRLLDSIPDF